MRAPDCPKCGRVERYWEKTVYRAYIRKYDSNGKAKWIPKGWICEKSDTFVPDGKEK